MKKPNKSLPVALAIGFCVSIGITILGAVAITFLIAGEKLAPESMGYGAVGTLLLAAMAGAGTSTALHKEKLLLVSLAEAGIYYLGLICATAMFFDGQYANMGVTALAVLGGGLAVSLFYLKKAHARPRKKKYKY